MPRVMKHSWVTRSTQWPLRTVREMIRAGDTLGDDDAPEMPDFMSTLNVLDIPRQVSGCGRATLCMLGPDSSLCGPAVTESHPAGSGTRSTPCSLYCHHGPLHSCLTIRLCLRFGSLNSASVSEQARQQTSVEIPRRCSALPEGFQMLCVHGGGACLKAGTRCLSSAGAGPQSADLSQVNR